MGERWGLGPVFAFEWLITARRWQVYAGRALAVGLLLAAIGMAWWANQPDGAVVTAGDLATLGESVRSSVLAILVTLVLLVAPAATAGSICHDRARGGLTHLMTTDLSDPEIVLGKLAARLIPVLGLIFGTLPVLAITTLLGGIDPLALLGTFAVTLGLALLGVSLALALSVWARKPQEVLLAAYAIWGGWVLANPIGELVAEGFAFRPNSRFARFLEFTAYLNPYTLAFAPHETWDPWLVGFDLVFLAAASLISGGLAVLTIRRLRPVSARLAGEAARGTTRWPPGLRLARLLRPWRGPSLDGNPVLWREWHRQRPSRWTRRVWGVYYTGAALLSLLAVMAALRPGRPAMGTEVAGVINGFGIAIGLLLLSVAASTSLGEERVRGHLDVLMATPLSTRSILVGKWLGAFRPVPWLALLPTLVAAAVALRSGRWHWVVLLTALIVGYGAAITSLGLLLATVFSRPARAVGCTVAVYVFVCIGWVLLAEPLVNRNENLFGLLIASPLLGSFFATAAVEHIRLSDGSQGVFLLWAIGWCLTYGLIAASLFRITLGIFDRRLGRASERPRRRPKRLAPPRPRVPAASEARV